MNSKLKTKKELKYAQGCDGSSNEYEVDKLYKCFIEKQDLDFTHGQTGM